jgi:DNA modification methylase
VLLYTQPGDIVYDPSFGAAGMMEAATGLGRHFVGWECDLDAYKVSLSFASHENVYFACRAGRTCSLTDLKRNANEQ